MKSYDEGYRSVKEKYQKRLSEKGEQQHENFKIVINNRFDRRRFASIATVAVVFVLLVAVVLPISLMNGFGDFFNPGGNFSSSDSSETSIDLQNGYPIQSGIWGIEYKCSNFESVDTLKLRPHSVTITSYEELQINFGYLQVYSDMGVKQLFDALSIYDQNFFRDQALVFLTVFEPSSTTKRDVEVAEKVYSQERTNETTIFLIDKSPSEMKNDEEAIWSYLIPIPAENALNEKYIKIIDKEEDYNKQPVLIRDSGVLKTELTYLSDKIIVEEKATPDDLRSFSFSAELYCIYGNYKNPSGMMLSYAEIIDQNGNVIMHSQDQNPQYNRLFGPIEQGKTETWGYYFSESVVQRPYSMPVFPAGTYDIRIVAPGAKDLYIEDAILIEDSSDVSELKKDYPIQSGVWGIQQKNGDPYYSSITITSREEIQLYIEQCRAAGSTVDEQLFNALSVYDNNFFIKNALIVLTAFEPSSSTKRDIEITHQPVNGISISLTDTDPLALKEATIAVWTYLIPIPAERAFDQKFIESDLRYQEVEQDDNMDNNPPIKDSSLYKVEVETDIEKVIKKSSNGEKRKITITVTIKCISGTYYTGNGAGLRAPDVTIYNKSGKRVLYSNYTNDLNILKRGESNVMQFDFYESETLSPNTMYEFPSGSYDVKITNQGIKDVYIKDAFIVE